MAIEINLSSNARILQVAGRNHPFTDYRAFGVPVTLSTDDEGIARSDLTNEYQIAVETYDLQYQDVKALARNSLEFSFLPGQSLWTSERPLRPVPECADDQLGETKPSEPCRGFLVMNQRAHEQWRLEARFGEFEKLSMLEY